MSDEKHVSLESEQAVLGSLLSDETAFDQVADILSPEIFFNAPLRVCCAEAIRLVQERKPLDPLTLLARLQGLGLSPEPVAAELPFDLSRVVGTTANVRHYVEHLRSLWAHRQARLVAREILADARTIPGDELAADFGRRISAIEVRRGRELRKIGLACVELLETFDRARRGDPVPDPFWPTGFSRLDALIGGIAPGKLTVVGARPSVGKTALMMALADNLAAHGVAVGIFELEDDEVTLARRCVARRSKVATTLLRGAGRSLRAEHWEKLSANDLWQTFETYPIFVDDDHGLNAEQVAARMRRYAREKGVKVFFVDHLLELALPDRRDGRRDVAIGEALSLLRNTAKVLGVGLVVMHQLSRDIERRKDQTPNLSDLKDSGSIEQEARVIIFLSRQGKDFILDVAKQSEGPKGQVFLDWLEDSMGIEDRRVD